MTRSYSDRGLGLLLSFVVLVVASRARGQPVEEAPEPAAGTEPTPGEDEEADGDTVRGLIDAHAAELAALRARLDAIETSRAAEVETEAATTAPPGPTLHPLASLFTRFEHREGYDRLASSRALQNVGCYGGPVGPTVLADSDCVRYRARVGLEVRDIALGDGAVAVIRFLPQVTGMWAMPGLGLGGPAVGSSSGGIIDALLGIHEASLLLQFGELLRVELGRFEMSYGDQVVIGSLDWHPNGRAFDGLRARLAPAGATGPWVDAFFTLVNEGHAVSLAGAPTGGGFGQADQYFYGLYAGLDALLDARSTTALDVYALGLQSNNRLAAATPGNETEWSLRATLGARFRFRADVIDLRVEGAVQLGREGGVRAAPTDAFGPAQDVVAGFGIGEIGLVVLDDRLRLALEGNFASGDDPTSTRANEGYVQLFPTAHAFFGFTNVMGARTNVASGVFHLLARPVDPLSIQLDVHAFVVPERGARPTSYAGAEGDLNLVWTPLTGLRLRAMYGLFLPETAFWRAAGATPYATDAVHFLEVEVGFVLR